MPAVDPNAPVQQAGETFSNYSYRLQDYMQKQGGGAGSEHARMAAGWVAIHISNPAPTAWTIK